MDSFYKNWLLKNKQENQIARDNNNIRPTVNTANIGAPMTQANDANPTSSKGLSDVESHNSSKPTDISQIIFENDEMELFIEKAAHLRQKKFDLQDHIFHMKIKLKNSNSTAPLLRDILDFLQAGFSYILENVRKFYNSEDHNIAFLTLFQRPMINGLNTGNYLSIALFIIIGPDIHSQPYQVPTIIVLLLYSLRTFSNANAYVAKTRKYLESFI